MDKDNSRSSFQSSNLQPEMVLDLLSRLVNKSLVIKEEKGGQARYRMLETIRQYAVHQLYAVEAEIEELNDRHRNWFLVLAEIANPFLRTKEQLGWLDRLELEHDNLRAALHWSLEYKHVVQALRLVWALSLFWDMHSHYQEAYRWTQRALDLAETDPVIRQSRWWARGMIGFFEHFFKTNWDITAIIPLLEEACDISLQQDDLLIAGNALSCLGSAVMNLGRREAAERYFRKGVEILQQYEGNSLYSSHLTGLGVVVAIRGDYAASREYYRKCLELHKLHGDRHVTLQTMLFYGDDLLLQGQVNAALEILLQAVRDTAAMGTRHEMPRCLIILARIALMQGDFAQAREWAGKIFPVKDEFLGGSETYMLFTLTMIDLHENQLEAAHAKAIEAFDQARQHNDPNDPNVLFRAYLNMGRVELKRAGPVSAWRYLKEAQDLRPENVWWKDDDNYLLTQALAQAARLEGQYLEARRLYDTNLRLMQKAQHYLYVPEILEGLAMVDVEQGRPELAARLLGASQSLRAQMGTPLPPVLQEQSEACLVRLGQALPPDELGRLWNEGEGMPVELAIALALGKQDQAG